MDMIILVMPDITQTLATIINIIVKKSFSYNTRFFRGKALDPSPQVGQLTPSYLLYGYLSL